MNKIPTAEEWLKHFEENAYPDTPISECMIEFAKLHVEAQLKAILKNVQMTGIAYGNDKSITDYEVDKESIINAYPLDQIK
jgi:hypothetical protein